MAIYPRPQVARLSPCAHGSVGDRELLALGLKPQKVLDFSVNSNPFGPSPKVAEALAQADISRYPDPEAWELREALAQHLGREAEKIIVGNGSVELIWLAALAYLNPGDPVLIMGPTFGEYETACQIGGGIPHFLNARVQDTFQPDLKRACYLIEKERPKLVFLCNPNNPTGTHLHPREVEEIRSACKESLLVVDEAYIAFVPWGRSCIDSVDEGNLLVLRSMTKDYGLAGLRLGYAMGAKEIITNLRKVSPPWNTNVMAQAAGRAALRDGEHLEQTLRGVWAAKGWLMDELSALGGLKVYPSAANFFLMEVGDAPSFRADLLKKGYCVRDCTSFGLPSFVRIGVRTLPECQRLVMAIRAVLNHDR